MTDEHKSLIAFGSDVELKHIEGTIWELKGALVLFGDDKERDFDADHFTPNETDYDLNEDGTGESSVYFNHGQDKVIGKTRIGVGKAKLTKDERAVWMRHHLDIAKEYDNMVVELIQKRKAESGKNWGLSSGVPGHLVDRQPAQRGYKITYWPLGKDASITLIPNDWRHTLVDANQLEKTNVKSLLTLPETQDPEATDIAGSVASEGFAALETPIVAVPAVPTIEIITEDGHMTEDVQVQADNTANSAMKAELDALKAANVELSANVAAILKHMQEDPRIAKSGYFSQDGGTQDAGIKSAGDLMLSMARKDHKRVTQIYGLKAITEASGPNVGYYLGEQVLTDLFGTLSLSSGITNRVRRVPVSTPTGRIPMPDYSRVPTANVGASATARGIESQARAEGGAYTEETPYVEQIRWEVADAASGYVKASREAISDIPLLESMLRMGIEEDVVNKKEHYILRGNGAGQPLGVLNWSGSIGLAEDGANNFAVADMDEMVSRLLIADGNKVAWAYSNSVYPEIAQLERGTGGAVMHNIQGALPSYLSGYPQFMTQHLPALGTTGYIVLGDWSKYLLFELGGLYIEMSEHADFLNGNTVWRFGQRLDGRPVLTSAVTLADGTTTLSPFVYITS